MMTLSYEIKRSLVWEMMEVLEHYEYDPSYDACEKIIDTWFSNKAKVMEPFTKLPGWKEDRFMVVKDKDYERKASYQDVENFLWWANGYMNRNLVPNMFFGKFNYTEICRMIDRCSDEIKILENPLCYKTTNGNTKANLAELRKRYVRLNKEFESKNACEYTQESISKKNLIYDLMGKILAMTRSENFSNIIDDELAKYLNNLGADFGFNPKAVAGQRIMKALRKFFVWAGLDKSSEYNSWIAKLGDAINPLKYTRFTILSFNPIDYLRMSMGTSWTSCHTIDKLNVDDRDGDNYEGMHANGTISYMLDEVSAVFYTLHKEYDGKDFEMEDKVVRQMFYLGNPENPVFIAGRLYPQSNDVEGESLRKQIREVVQYDVAKAWEIDNLWTTRPSTEGERMYITNGSSSHYPDYTYSSFNCKCCVAKDREVKPITIGYKGICIECGRTNTEDGQLSCCHELGATCYECGYDGQLHEVDGHYYCEDCCFYCDYHGEWEIGNKTYVEGYGDICDNAYEYGDFFTCDYCGEVHHLDCEIYVEDNYGYYCSEYCANEAGYIQLENGSWTSKDDAVEIDAEWHHIDECRFCENCNHYVLAKDYNEEKEMCNECAEEEVA